MAIYKTTTRLKIAKWIKIFLIIDIILTVLIYAFNFILSNQTIEQFFGDLYGDIIYSIFGFVIAVLVYEQLQKMYDNFWRKLAEILGTIQIIAHVVIYAVFGLAFISGLYYGAMGFTTENDDSNTIYTIPTVAPLPTLAPLPSFSYSKIPPITMPSFSAVDQSKIATAIYRLTNEQRTQNGLSSLKWDENLALIAREHSQDMADKGYFSHTNLQGESSDSRATRHGINIRKPLGGGSYMVGIGENIGKMPTGNVLGLGYVSNDVESIAQAQVQSWMNSPGHRSNILNSNYDRIGVGVAYDGSLYYISTQDFQ